MNKNHGRNFYAMYPLLRLLDSCNKNDCFQHIIGCLFRKFVNLTHLKNYVILYIIKAKGEFKTYGKSKNQISSSGFYNSRKNEFNAFEHDKKCSAVFL